WQGEAAAGTSVQFETRTSADGTTWSTWQPTGAGGAIASPANRYIQYRLNLATSDSTLSPEVRQVVISPASTTRDTTVADLSQCSTLNGTSVTNLAGGEVRLAALF